MRPAGLGQALGAGCLVLVMATGCGSASHTAASDAPSSAAASTGPPPVTADVRACAGAKAVIGHLTADTAHWSPTRHPFDKAVSRRIAAQAHNLAAQGPQAADPGVSSSMWATAAAFTRVSRAIRARDRAKLDGAIAQSRVTYKALKQACSWDKDG